MVLLGSNDAVTANFRKNDLRDDLLALAVDVMTSVVASAKPSMTAREAARAVVGLVGWVSKRSGVLAMQDAMSDLARHGDAWNPEHPFRSLPTRYDGRVDENLALIASVISAMVPLFGLRNMRSAVAFWATESDPEIWRDVAAA